MLHARNCLFDRKLRITARQYGEVVLPDAASGQGPGTPRQRGHETVPVQGTPSPRLRRPKEGMAHFLPSFSLRSPLRTEAFLRRFLAKEAGYKFYWALRVSRRAPYRRSGVQV